MDIKKGMRSLSVVVAITAIGAAPVAADAIFDEPTGTDVIAPQIDVFDDFVVRAGLSGTFNAATTDNWSRDDVNFAEVWWDRSPPDGGLGVLSDVSGDTYNFEGSLSNNVNNDEILFFDFDFAITLTQVLLNAGDDTGPGSHQDLFDPGDSDVFDIFSSVDGINYSCIFCANTAPANGEELNLPWGTTGQYFAVAHLGPTDAIGGYIESIHYTTVVPEPGTLALLGAGLLGLGIGRRRRRA